MHTIQALLLGIIQGITEFFPVSSSTHLRLAKSAFGVIESSPFFDLACHCGTTAALLIGFRKDILSLFTSNRKWLKALFLGTLVLVPAYVVLRPIRVDNPSLSFLGFMLILSGIFLFSAQFLGKQKNSLSLRRLSSVGFFQALALIPGISRSGATLSGGLLVGMTPSAAVRFSFLLSIPATLGGTLLESLKIVKSHSFSSTLGISSLLGFSAAFVSGIFALHFAIKILEKGRWKPFAAYMMVLGIALIVGNW